MFEKSNRHLNLYFLFQLILLNKKNTCMNNTIFIFIISDITKLAIVVYNKYICELAVTVTSSAKT